MTKDSRDVTTPRMIKPISPANPATARRPLRTAAVITSGFWGDRQRVNAAASIPAGWHWLEKSGALPNFLAVGAGASDLFIGEVNQDAEAYKWVEAASYEVARADEPELRRQLDVAVAAIVAAQAPDGYLHTWHQLNPGEPRFSGLREGGPDETYTAGHLLHAAIAYHRATGDRRLIDAALKLAACVKDQLFDPDLTMVTGHPGLEMGLVELYRETSESWLLELAAHLVNVRGHGVLGSHRFGSSHYQDYLPIRELPVLAGHAVAGLYLMCGATDVAVETGDDDLLASLCRIWDATVATRAYITGGLGSRPKAEDFGDDYELPSESSYCETCAAVAMVMWSWRMLVATGEKKYSDTIERTLHNGVLVGVSLEGTHFRYDNPLQVSGGHRTPAERARGERSEWFELACCPPNVMRLIASLGHYLANTSGSTLFIEHYASSEIDWDDSTVVMDSNSPWEASTTISYRGEDRAGTIAFRVPGWARSPLVDGAAATAVDGYVRVSRDWTDGDVVVIEFDQSPRFMVANPRVDDLRGAAVIEDGPLVYAIEEVDNPFALDDVRLSGDGSDFRAVWNDSLGVRSLTGTAGLQDPAPWGPELYRPLKDTTNDVRPVLPISLTAIPYFAWGNRGACAMRTWVPLASTGTRP
jgi:uncharacterized protein